MKSRTIGNMLTNSLSLADLQHVDRLAEARELGARWQAYRRGERVTAPSQPHLRATRATMPPTPAPPAGHPRILVGREGEGPSAETSKI